MIDVKNAYPYILLFLVTGLSSFSLEAQKGNGALPHSSTAFVVIAHRGNHAFFPENTIPAIKAAIEAGAQYVEIDARETLDSVMILMHDATVDRTTNGKGAVSTLTYAQIQALHTTAINGEQYTVPTFSEVLQVCKNKINIYLDFKNANVAKAWSLIQQAGMEHQIIVYPNTLQQYQEWQVLAPQMPIITSVPAVSLSVNKLHTFYSTMPIAVVDNLYNDSLIKIAHAHHVKVWLDVEGAHETPEIWNKFLKMGVDGLQTDHPQQLLAYIKKVKEGE
ncbi:glycerophosphodiester phosphodiesterase family protein [Hydrotalea sp.]|uniref:glycerophosphodiester phosphodiesterase family protein n=1 Tax=Hydrotalea sp. TaxID=2881279 RepID=UPI002624BC88|nr:glycerophosphodiester phosphodiesterase family protein [Hydrotalea sp.]